MSSIQLKCFCLILPAFAACFSAGASIRIDGVMDRTNYVGFATLWVSSETGYTYRSLLDGSPLPEDTSTTLMQPSYHELLVTRTNNVTLAGETNLVRFNVTAAERGATEAGIYPWTPYPPVHSSSNECLSARLILIAPSNFPAGMEIPFVALTENDAGLGKRLTGTVTFNDFPGIDIRRGAGFSFLPAQTAGTMLMCTGSLKSIFSTRPIRIDSSTTWTTPASTITTNTIWGPDARISITSNILVTNNAVLTIRRGTIVRLDAGTGLSFAGTLVVIGTREEPVVFIPSNRAQPWGGFVFGGTGSSANVSYAIITGSGANPDWMPQHGVNTHRPEEATFFLGAGAGAALTNVYIVDIAGQAWVGEASPISLRSCLVQKALTSGQFNGCTSTVANCTIQQIPNYDESFANGDNDGIYLERGSHAFVDTYIGWTKDDAIDTGSYDGPITVSNSWLESCFHEGMATAGEGRQILCNGLTVLNCGQAVECGYAWPTTRVDNCLLVNNEIGLRFGDNYAFGYGGLLAASNSIVLYNDKDVWNMCFDIWGPKKDNMTLQSNLLSQTQLDDPDNAVWNPATDAWRLAPFINRATTNGPVGVGFPRIVYTNQDSAATGTIMVSLSMFATNPVYVSYFVAGGTATAGQDHALTNGTLTFMPGEFRKPIHFPLFDDLENTPPQSILIGLSNAINAEIAAGQSVLTYYIPGPAIADWTAFNDCAWSAGERSANITTGRPSGVATFSLLSRFSGSPLPVQASFTGVPASVWPFAFASPWPTGSDAAVIFDGHVACNANYTKWDTGTVTFALSGLDPLRLYSVAIFSSRGTNGTGTYSNRWTDIRLEGATSFVNQSSIGVMKFSSNSVNDSARMSSDNMEGKVVRFDDIIPPTNGALRFQITANGTAGVSNAYLNAFMVRQLSSVPTADANVNGLPDSWETYYFGTTNAADGGTLEDYDRDGFANYFEFRAGTDPSDPVSRLVLTPVIQPSSTGFVVQWQSESNMLYTIEKNVTLTNGWSIEKSGVYSTPPVNTYTNAVIDPARSFYRIKVE